MRNELMGKSGHLSGATFALQLLPRDIEAAQSEELVAVLDGPPPDANGSDAVPVNLHPDLVLRGGDVSVPLAKLSALFEMGVSVADSRVEAGELSSSSLHEELSRLLAGVLVRKGADIRSIYWIGLDLAMLSRTADAYELITLLDARKDLHPAILALKGYLALQSKQVDAGRRALGRAALASRGYPERRGILHFAQHVLLMHQFNG
jgi:hypothetical protein